MTLVRPAREGDLPSIVSLLFIVRPDAMAFGEEPTTELLRALLYRDGAYLLVAEDDRETIIGAMTLLLGFGPASQHRMEFGIPVIHPDADAVETTREIVDSALQISKGRPHVALFEIPADQPNLQGLAQEYGYRPIGFLPYGAKSVLLVNLNSEVLPLRRPNPRIIPEAAHLAQQVARYLNQPFTTIVDDEAPSFQSEGYYEMELVSEEGYADSLYLLRTRYACPDVVGPDAIQYGPLRLKLPNTQYLLSSQYGSIVGAAGIAVDPTTNAAHIFELLGLNEDCYRNIIDSLEMECFHEQHLEAITIDVSAYAARLQRTLSELNFVPVAYLPAYWYQGGDRADVIRMVKLNHEFQAEAMPMTPEVQYLTGIVTRSLVQRRALPRISEAVQHLSLFENLSEEQTERLSTTCSLQRFKPGEVMLQRGQRSGKMMVLMEGTAVVRMERDGAEVGRVETGESLGEIGFLSQTPHTAFAIAENDVEAAIFEEEEFQELIRRRPDIGVLLYRNIATEIGKKLVRTNLSIGGEEVL